jgi:hypothetical protein
MSTQVRAKSLVIPIDIKKTGRKVLTSSTLFVKTKKREFLLTLTILTWIVAMFVTVAFFFAVRNTLAEADLLACILLGTVFLGWIILASYFRATGTTARPTGKRERNDQHHPAPTTTAFRAVTRKDQFE